jgi:sulfur-carrier protein
MPTILIPAALRAHTDKKDQVVFLGSNLKEVLANMIVAHGGLAQYIFSSDGDLCSFINVFINGEDSRFLRGLETPVDAHDTILLLPALAGG